MNVIKSSIDGVLIIDQMYLAISVGTSLRVYQLGIS